MLIRSSRYMAAGLEHAGGSPPWRFNILEVQAQTSALTRHYRGLARRLPSPPRLGTIEDVDPTLPVPQLRGALAGTVLIAFCAGEGTLASSAGLASLGPAQLVTVKRTVGSSSFAEPPEVPKLISSGIDPITSVDHHEVHADWLDLAARLPAGSTHVILQRLDEVVLGNSDYVQAFLAEITRAVLPGGFVMGTACPFKPQLLARRQLEDLAPRLNTAFVFKKR